MPRKKLFAMLAAVVLIAGTITLTSVSVANANAEETARLCAVAFAEGARATKGAEATIAAADTALEAVKTTALPADAGTSTSYPDRPAVAAVNAVRAVDAGEGVVAVTGVPAVKARASGTDFIGGVTDARAALVKITISAECIQRDQAEAITASAAKANTATTALDTSVRALTADFNVFQNNEAARIAAEIEAARVAAEIEAVRIAAEAAAAAAAEAARIATEQAHAAQADDYDDSGHSGGGSTVGGSSGGGRPSGGGQVGPGGGNNGVCWTWDPAVGQKPCGT